MSKPRNRRRQPAPMREQTLATVAKDTPRPQSWGSAFDAARQQGYRGFFYFPSLDPSEQMPEYDRQTIAEKINWCYNNLGFVRPVVDGLALDDVDTGLWPKPATANRAFNARVKVLWQQQCGWQKSFDAAGENNFYSMQYQVRREIYLRGDCFGVKLRRGEAASCPQLAMLPSWQCTNDAAGLTAGFRDGRLNNKFGRALRFRITTNAQKRTSQDYDAADIIHFHDPFLIGQTRGMSILAPVVRKMFRVDDLEKAESSGVLLRSRVAYAIERQEGDEDGPTLLPGAREVKKYTDENGVAMIVQRIEVADGSEVEIADLTGGKKLKVIESTKSSEAASWIKELLTDIAYTTLRPPEYIFSLAGLSQGTLVRMAQQKVQRVVNTIRDFQLILQNLDEWWPFWLWQNIAGGQFSGVRGGVPDEWWKYLVVRPRDMTVDAGREGRLYDERIANGRMPAGLYVGMMYGEDEEEFEDEIIRDAYRRRLRNREIAAELGEEEIPVEQIFRPPTGSAAPATPQADNPEDPPPAKPAKEDA